jgi:uncharacterized repeat protein (TIGR03803 family)
LKTPILRRYVLCISVVAASLAACAGSQPPIGAPDTMPQDQPVVTSRAMSRHIGTELSSYRLLYSFGRGSDGQQPYASLIDVNSTLYGTTYDGGAYNGGTVFRVSTTGTEHVLHSFGHGHDGQQPEASLIDVNGTLYGTTYEGGSYNAGTFFSISMNGTEHVLHNFSNLDGVEPVASLIDVNGTLYGTSIGGGRYTYGTVFSIGNTGTVHVLHSFGDGHGGDFPYASLIDVDGTLYSTTYEGGAYHGHGTVFSINTTGREHTLHSFGDGHDGAYPAASLIDVKGALYGTTTSGGARSIGRGGTVFSINTTGTEHVLHSFGNGHDGAEPVASLIDVKGTLYGTTFYGGAYGGSFEGGTVFSISTTGTEHVLHSFGGKSDGSSPEAGLLDVNGTLYGTTTKGGTYGDGTIFTLKP